MFFWTLYVYGEKKCLKSKTNAIFCISVRCLLFRAFAGYCLCFSLYRAERFKKIVLYGGSAPYTPGVVSKVENFENCKVRYLWFLFPLFRCK